MISIVSAVRSLADGEKVIKNLGANIGYEIILVEGKNPSYQRNCGVNEAAGDVIYFMDDDTVVPAGMLKAAEEIFSKDSGLAVLGGPELAPESDSLLQKVFGAAFASPWAAGKSSARYAKKGSRRQTDEKELILCNMFIRKTVFTEAGGFNEKLYPNEENELLSRFKDSGLSLVYDPDIFVYRSKRRDYPAFIKQCFNYGRGRAEQSAVRFKPEDVINFIPAFFVIYLFSELLFGAADFLPLLLYAAGTVYFSYVIFRQLKYLPSFFMSILSFFLLHVSYGAGSIYGIFTSFNLQNRNLSREIKIKKARS